MLYESVLKGYFFINIGFFKYPMSLTILLKLCVQFFCIYMSMVTTIICVFLWISDIFKELRNVLYESVLKAYFFFNLGSFMYSMFLTVLTKFHDDRLNSLHMQFKQTNSLLHL